jgi:V8-like Glu-specific endopeptidase
MEIELSTPVSDFQIDVGRLLPGTEIGLLQRTLTHPMPVPDDLPVGDAGRLEAEDYDSPLQALAATEGERQRRVEFEQVYGDDDRRQVGDSNRYPFSAVCCLRMKFPDGWYQGTGCLIAADVILTVAHNVYDRATRNSASQVIAFRAANGTGVNRMSARKIWCPDRYRTAAASSKRRYDYAVVQLAEPYAAGGALGIATYSDEQFHRARHFNIVGYPVDKPSLTMWTHARPTVAAGADLLRYTIDTKRGHSGSPIIDRIEHQGRDYYLVVGVHSGYSGERNVGVRMNQRVWKDVKPWLPAAP